MRRAVVMWLIAAGVIGGVVVVVVLVGHRSGPAERSIVAPDADPFYSAPVPAGLRPGEVLRHRPVEVPPGPGADPKLRPRAWQVIYRSTAAGGGPNIVSGTVLVPETPWTGGGPRPVIGYGVSTHGLGDRCAPSYSLATGTEVELSLIGLALRRGWAVAVTDYEGLGTPGDHTYLVARAEGRAVLDAVRAAIGLPGSGLTPQSPVGLWGYSQGGGAAAAAAEQVPAYAPELRTVGVAAGGVPADLPAVVRYLDGGPYFGLVAAAVAGVGAAYPGPGVPGSAPPPAGELLGFVRQACAAQFTDGRLAGHRVAELLPGPDPLGPSPLSARFAENRIGAVAPPMPVRLYAGLADEFIPPAVVQALAGEYCGRGVVVQFEAYPGRNHGDVGYGGAEAAVGWLADRFAGRPAPDTCRR